MSNEIIRFQNYAEPKSVDYYSTQCELPAIRFRPNLNKSVTMKWYNYLEDTR